MSETCIHIDVPLHGLEVEAIPTLIEVQSTQASTLIETDCIEQALSIESSPVVVEMDEGLVEILVEPEVFEIEVSPNAAQGAQGIQGPPGEGNILQYMAAEALGGYRAVYYDDASSGVRHASNLVLTHSYRLAGITTHAAGMGLPVLVRHAGEIQDASFSFTPGEPVFFNSSGVLTNTPPASGYSLVVGKALDVDRFMVEIATPVYL